MASSSLDKKTRAIINKWSAYGFYVYMRPLTSKFIDPKAKHRVYWSVSVEFRNYPPGQWSGEGYNLDEIIAELDTRVPKGTRVGGRQVPAGYLAPKSVTDREVRKAKKKGKRK